MEKEKKYTYLGAAIFVLIFIVIGIINHKKKDQALKNGIVVIATIKSTDGGREGTNVHVQYELNGKIVNNIFVTYMMDSLKTNGKVRLLISRDSANEYVRYIGVVK